MAPKNRPKNHPLLVRPGARYTCFGDGLCCTDIHGIGPITKKELKQVRRLDPEAGGYNEHFEDYMLATAADGGCVFLLPDRRCRIHATVGPEHKPEGCRRFPLGLTATPMGGRVTTDHRCPCRTLGDRPLITPEAAEPSLRDGEAPLESDRDIRKIPLTADEKVSFEEWLPKEAKLLERLAAGASPARVLGAKPFPRLKGPGWKKTADELIAAKDGTQFGLAIAWFGDTILELVEARAPRPPARPWSPAFERAERRSPEVRSAREVFNDWLADEIWSLKWAEEGDFATARAELATRHAIADDIAKRLVASGTRTDRAAAEGVMIVELVGESDYWSDVVERIRL